MKKPLTAKEARVETRFIWTMVVVISVIIGVALYGYLMGGWEAKGEEAASRYEPHLVGLDKEALEAAYREHLKLLFSVWLKDDIAAEQRIRNGLRIARRAYASAADQLEKREQALKR